MPIDLIDFENILKQIYHYPLDTHIHTHTYTHAHTHTHTHTHTDTHTHRGVTLRNIDIDESI